MQFKRFSRCSSPRQCDFACFKIGFFYQNHEWYKFASYFPPQTPVHSALDVLLTVRGKPRNLKTVISF